MIVKNVKSFMIGGFVKDIMLVSMAIFTIFVYVLSDLDTENI